VIPAAGARVQRVALADECSGALEALPVGAGEMAQARLGVLAEPPPLPL